MSILIHDNMSRGRTRLGWLDSFHSFSFGGFLDPARMGFGRLRVINEDRIIPGAGFARHDHAGMDILTIVLSGRIRHEDSLGNVDEIVPGEMQLMRAGSGVSHSEWNASESEPAHVLQIWLIPDEPGGAPSYRQVPLPANEAGWSLLASGNPGEAPLLLGSDTRVLLARPREGVRMTIEGAPGRLTFVQVVKGIATVEGERLVAGDGIQLSEEALPDVEWASDGEVLLFDMAGSGRRAN